MKRAKAADRVSQLGTLFYLLGDIAEESHEYEAADAYRHAGRLADREADKIKEKL